MSSAARLFAGPFAAVFCFIAPIGEKPATQAPKAEKKSEEVNITDSPISNFRTQLLDLAFEVATAIPVEPHLKDRSKAQESVVSACLELDQAQRALKFAERINNWRRGSAYADLAFYFAKRGWDANRLQPLMGLATQVSESAEDWRKDRIRVKLAKTHALLGNHKVAEKLEEGVVDAETGKVDSVRAETLDPEALDKQLAGVDKIVESGNFDLIRNSLEGCVQLFNRFFSDVEKRDRIEKKIKSSWNRIPLMVRVELMMELVEFSLEHKDQPKALSLVNDTQAVFESAPWTAEYGVPLMARISGLRARAGEKEAARKSADAALALFEKDREKIANIYRAGALRPLAEAYQAMGNSPAALALYQKIVEEGVENPNSRPRAEDLSATCLSMALSGVEPDSALWTRIQKIKDGLGKPW